MSNSYLTGEEQHARKFQVKDTPKKFRLDSVHVRKIDAEGSAEDERIEDRYARVGLLSARASRQYSDSFNSYKYGVWVRHGGVWRKRR